jgi:hypothetical protein
VDNPELTELPGIFLARNVVDRRPPGPMMFLLATLGRLSVH